MTKKNPDERYTVDQCLAHDWFKMETATKQEVKSHYYEKMGKNEPGPLPDADVLAQTLKMQKLRAKFYLNLKLHR